MIRPTRPGRDDVEQYRREVELSEPTYPSEAAYRTVERQRIVGSGAADLRAGADVLRAWEMHGGAGVDATPSSIAVGSTVVLSTSTLGLWLVFACRITDVVDSEEAFGFTYVTLPGHPEEGEETFVVSIGDDGSVSLRISATSRPALLLSRLSGPIGRRLQARYIDGYLEAMKRGIARRH